MSDLTVFHSGSPNWASCKKAIVVAEEMKKIFGDTINLNIYFYKMRGIYTALIFCLWPQFWRRNAWNIL